MHVVLAAATAALAALVAVIGVARGIRGRPSLHWLDRAILAALSVIAAGALVGAALLASGPGPRDALHFVYAAAAFLALPIARFARSGLSPRLRSTAVVVGGVTLVALTVRLLQTG